MHAIDREELMAYLDGELLVERAAAAAAHLEECEECRRFAAELQDLSRRLQAWEVATPRSFQAPVRPGRRFVWHSLLKPVMAVAGGGLLLLLGLASINLRTGTQRALLTSYKNVAPLTQHMEPFPAPALAEAVLRGPLVIRTASVELTTRDFDRARAELEATVKRHNGYVSEMNVRTPAGANRSLNATLRVPADQLEATLAELRKLGSVESESQTGEDVTQQHVDLEARLSNARNTEQRLKDLIRQGAGKLSDVLAVEVEIGRVRGEIERMEAERKHMANQVTYATIRAGVTEEDRLHVVPTATAARFRNAAIEGYRALTGGIIGVALFAFSAGPSLLFWGGLLFFVGRFAWKRVRRSRAA